MTCEEERAWRLEGFQRTANGWLVLVTDPHGLPTIEALTECAKAAPSRKWSSEQARQQLHQVERLAVAPEPS